VDDFSDVFAGLSVSPAVLAIVAAGNLVAVFYFTRWIVNMVSGFFDDDLGYCSDDEIALADAGICVQCGGEIEPNSFCPDCDADYLRWASRDDGDGDDEEEHF
jgi:hypothetical protein